ncbi:MAG: hypothetical protein ACRYF4_09515 [Janthinobacterium lividum]
MTLAGRLLRTSLLPFGLLGTHALAAQPVAANATHTCDTLPHADHPKTTLHSGDLSAVVFLPDAQTGYYRGSRFDWGGIVGCASLHGHTFFGEWFDRYEPTISDAVTGPAEEFRHPTSEIGYDEAKPGEPFLKIGVGVLRRVDTKPYFFGTSYPIVDGGAWTVKTGKSSITFRQELHSAFGYAYVYEKTLTLDGQTNTLSVSHRLQNVGTKPLETAVYSHDFFMLDHQPTGPGMELRLPFVPVPDNPLPTSAEIDGKTIRIVAPLEPKRGLGAYITGFSGKATDFDFTFENKSTGVGVQETSDSPLVKMYLWATPKTFCPEGYIAIHVEPGAAQSWTMRYRLFTK